MNYDELKALALSYSDRQDAGTINNLDNFLRMVEARVNRVLQVQKMSRRAFILASADTEYYGLPSDFAGLRDIEIQDADTGKARVTASYVSPEQMNNHVRNTGKSLFYTIVANQIQIYPTVDNDVLQIIYYAQVPPLTHDDNTNWLSDDAPDVYLHGLMIEISSFVKDATAAALWETRFNSAVAEIVSDDADTRWSGTALQIRQG